MTAIGMQMPQLFLRGSFVNVTIKNLTEEQRQEVSELVEEIKDDPLLQPSRYQFRNALRYTIKGDYIDDDASDQEYYVALWKAVVAAKFGWGKHEPSEETITNSYQRKKFFQTWIFNYLRQILQENKRSFANKKCVVMKPTFEAAKTEIRDILNKNGKVSKDNDTECIVTSDLFLLCRSKIDELLKCRDKYINKKVEITMRDDGVYLRNHGAEGLEMIQTTIPTLVNVTSASRTPEEGGTPEIPSVNTDGFNDPDSIEAMFDNLSEISQEVLKIIIDPPESYVSKYGEKPIKRYIQEYLGLTPKQVKDIWSEMKLAYAAIIGTPD